MLYFSQRSPADSNLIPVSVTKQTPLLLVFMDKKHVLIVQAKTTELRNIFVSYICVYFRLEHVIIKIFIVQIFLKEIIHAKLVRNPYETRANI